MLYIVETRLHSNNNKLKLHYARGACWFIMATSRLIAMTHFSSFGSPLSQKGFKNFSRLKKQPTSCVHTSFTRESVNISSVQVLFAEKCPDMNARKSSNWWAFKILKTLYKAWFTELSCVFSFNYRILLCLLHHLVVETR